MARFRDPFTFPRHAPFVPTKETDMTPITMDARRLTGHGTDAHMPVTTAVYTVQFVMNEDDPSEHSDHVAAFASEIQRVMDDANFTTMLRYDAVAFEVVSRIVIATTVNEEDN